MNTIRSGKIARLPAAIREQVNQKLADHESSAPLLAWLNALPEVQLVMAREFGGEVISRQNVHNWRRGGHQHWLRLQEAHAMMGTCVLPPGILPPSVLPAEAGLAGAGEKSMTETLASWLTAQYLVQAKSVLGQEAGPDVAWNRMREFCHDVVALRRGELGARRLELDCERLAFAREKMGKARVGALENPGTPHPDLLPSKGRRNIILGMLTQSNSVRHLATTGLKDVTPLGYRKWGVKTRVEDGGLASKICPSLLCCFLQRRENFGLLCPL